MADATSSIQADIDELKSRIAATADELDSRLAHLPRAADWLWRHRRALVIASTVTTGALAVLRGGSRRSQRRDSLEGDLDGRYEITVSRR
jgi:hypothetical protein